MLRSLGREKRETFKGESDTFLQRSFWMFFCCCYLYFGENRWNTLGRRFFFISRSNLVDDLIWWAQSVSTAEAQSQPSLAFSLSISHLGNCLVPLASSNAPTPADLFFVECLHSALGIFFSKLGEDEWVFLDANDQHRLFVFFLQTFFQTQKSLPLPSPQKMWEMGEKDLPLFFFGNFLIRDNFPRNPSIINKSKSTAEVTLRGLLDTTIPPKGDRFSKGSKGRMPPDSPIGNESQRGLWFDLCWLRFGRNAVGWKYRLDGTWRYNSGEGEGLRVVVGWGGVMKRLVFQPTTVHLMCDDGLW